MTVNYLHVKKQINVCGDFVFADWIICPLTTTDVKFPYTTQDALGNIPDKLVFLPYTIFQFQLCLGTT